MGAMGDDSWRVQPETPPRGSALGSPDEEALGEDVDMGPEFDRRSPASRRAKTQRSGWATTTRKHSRQVRRSDE